jgi:hypothetical protein
LEKEVKGGFGEHFIFQAHFARGYQDFLLVEVVFDQGVYLVVDDESGFAVDICLLGRLFLLGLLRFSYKNEKHAI